MNIVRVVLVRSRGVLVRYFLACVRVNSSPLCLEIYDVSEFFFFYPNLVVHLTSLIHIFTEFGP